MLLIGGWGTIVDVWDTFTLEVAKYFDVLFLETREKQSSILVKNSRHDLDRMSEDVKETLVSFGIDDSKLVIYALSWGTIVVADGLAKNKFRPFLTVFVGPVARLTLPLFTRYIISFAPFSIVTLFRPIAKFWIANVKSKNELEAAAKLRVWNEADLRKWHQVAKNVTRQHYWHLYSNIKSTCLIVYAKNDSFHESAEVKRIIRLVENSVGIEICGSEKLVSPLVAELIRQQAEVVGFSEP